jgi:ubiquinone/menaquinone biosynthesis C-methylase UbiE
MKSPYSPRSYWTAVAQSYGNSDTEGLAPVLHPHAPLWFNQMIDAAQSQAVSRALGLAMLQSGARILDVGCGTGRWLRRYEAMGLRTVGVDATLPMLFLARQNCSSAAVTAGEAFRLPFASGTFDAVSDITVVQHIPYESQAQALDEMVRVLRPGGWLILMELIRGRGTHIFPRPPEDWIRQTVLSGASPSAWFGQEFMLIDRAFVRVARALKGRKKELSATPGGLLNPTSANRSTAEKFYWEMRHLIAPISAFMDPITEMIFPGKVATHGVFVFRK